jgi:hypothetical protein
VIVGELRVMDRKGDSKHIWNPENADEVAAARTLFDELKRKGHMAYKVIGDGSKGEQLAAFDPNAGKIILAPPMQGGG